jgi:hypothetical protein
MGDFYGDTFLSFQSEPQVFFKVLSKTLTGVLPGAGIPLPRHIVVYFNPAG